MKPIDIWQANHSEFEGLRAHIRGWSVLFATFQIAILAALPTVVDWAAGFQWLQILIAAAFLGVSAEMTRRLAEYCDEIGKRMKYRVDACGKVEEGGEPFGDEWPPDVRIFATSKKDQRTDLFSGADALRNARRIKLLGWIFFGLVIVVGAAILVSVINGSPPGPDGLAPRQTTP